LEIFIFRIDVVFIVVVDNFRGFQTLHFVVVFRFDVNDNDRIFNVAIRIVFVIDQVVVIEHVKKSVVQAQVNIVSFVDVSDEHIFQNVFAIIAQNVIKINFIVFDAVDDFVEIVSFEGGEPEEHLIHDHSDGPNVALDVEFSVDDFW
jgi:hypothetical protein